MKALKTLILALLLIGIGGAAFRLSFDAQVTLATASGVNAGLAGLYPLVVDAAILMAVLIGIWSPDLRKALSRYLWGAIAFWTATSVLGNAIHVIALPTDRVTVAQWLAIAVNTIPALTLFLVIHIATTIAFRPAIKTGDPVDLVAGGYMTVNEYRAAHGMPGLDRPRSVRAPQSRPDVPPVSDEEILTMVDSGMSLSAIGASIGRSKSYAGNRVRDAKAALAASTEQLEEA